MTTDLARLHRRLRLTERLARDGATEGERTAARAAAARLRARIAGAVPPPEQTATAVSDEPLADAASPADLPSRRALRGWLAAWSAGRIGADGLRARAARVVDGAVLPDLPADDPDGVVVELLLVWAGAAEPLSTEDVAAAHAFLATDPAQTRAGWAAWLAHLAARAGHRQPRG